MKRKIFIGFFFLLTAISMAVLISCGGSQTNKFSKPSDTLNNYAPSPTLLEERGKDLGVTKDQEGHLTVSVPGSMSDDEIKFFRLFAYFNYEAKEAGNRKYYPYKLSGAYEPQDGITGFMDPVHYEIMFSSDSFVTPVDLERLALDLGLEVSKEGYLIASKGTPHGRTEAILTYLNAQAANEGRTYKFKAGYDPNQTRDGILISDRIDILVYFADDSAPEPIDGNSAIVARINSPSSEKRREIISRAVVAFSQVLEKPEMLTVTMSDFVGRTPHFPELVHLFNGKAVEELKQVLSDKKKVSASQIFILAETKKKTGRSLPPTPVTPLTKLPLGPKEMEIVAHVVEETIRVIRPSTLQVIIYDFNGNAPQNLTTWSFFFPTDRDTLIKLGNPTPSQIFASAMISENRGFTTGDRMVPYRKPLLPASPLTDNTP